MAKSWGENVPFFEASAKDKINDKEIFYQIVREMKKRKESNAEEEIIKKKKKKFCTLL